MGGDESCADGGGSDHHDETSNDASKHEKESESGEKWGTIQTPIDDFVDAMREIVNDFVREDG